MGRKIGCQLASSGLGHTDDILYACRVVYLSTYALGHHSHTQSLTRRIDGRRRPGGSSAEHREVVMPLCRLGCFGSRRGEPLLYLFQECAQVPPAYMQQLSIGIHRRHSLYAKPRHLLLAEAAVDHLAGDVRIEQRHDIECLDHIRAVCAGERDVGLEIDVGLDGLDAACERLVRHVAPLSVGIEQGQQQGGELMAIGDAPKGDVQIVAVLQNGEAEDHAVAVFHMDEGTRGGHVLYKLTEARVVAGATVALHPERERGVESPQHLSHLMNDLRF